MEVIRLAGYTEDEKLEIARRHLMPKQMDENGVSARDMNISRNELTAMIQRYTHEAGLRQLEREIGSVTGNEEFQRLSREIAGLLVHSSKREIYQVID